MFSLKTYHFQSQGCSKTLFPCGYRGDFSTHWVPRIYLYLMIAGSPFFHIKSGLQGTSLSRRIYDLWDTIYLHQFLAKKLFQYIRKAISKSKTKPILWKQLQFPQYLFISYIIVDIGKSFSTAATRVSRHNPNKKIPIFHFNPFSKSNKDIEFDLFNSREN